MNQPVWQAWICVLLALVLGGCAGQAPQSFRDTSQPISASARFEPEAFSGAWLIVAAFQPMERAQVIVTYDAVAQRLRVAGDEVPLITGLYRPGRPGELLPLRRGRSPLVVMWVDEDFETAVIGTPSGSFGAVLDRDGAVPDDRARATREVMAFYGWDVNALKRTGP